VASPRQCADGYEGLVARGAPMSVLPPHERGRHIGRVSAQ
jgi:hypothetical protein